MFSVIPAAPVRHTVPARALLRGDQVVLRRGAAPREVASVTKGSAAVFIRFADGTTATALRHDRLALAN